MITNHSGKDAAGAASGSYAEALAAHILKRCITVKAVRSYQEKESLPIEAAMNAIAAAITESIKSRSREALLDIGSEFLGPARHGDRHGDNTESAIETARRIAAEGYRRGYIDGFKDRESIS